MSNLRAVIFDLDGVILDSERIYRSCWQRAATDMECEVSDELYARLIGLKDHDAEQLLVQELGADFPMKEFGNRWAGYFEECLEKEEIPRKAGLDRLLDFLESRGLPTAIATSTHRQRALRSIGSLAQRFSVMVTGDEIEHGKPAPDIFLRAAERLNVPARRCWVIEDSEPGIRAASAAGMTPVLVPDLKVPSAGVRDLAAYVCSSLDEVRDVFEKAV